MHVQLPFHKIIMSLKSLMNTELNWYKNRNDRILHLFHSGLPTNMLAWSWVYLSMFYITEVKLQLLLFLLAANCCFEKFVIHLGFQPHKSVRTIKFNNLLCLITLFLKVNLNSCWKTKHSYHFVLSIPFYIIPSSLI